MKSQIRTVDDHGLIYQALCFICPGCIAMNGSSGFHMLPVNNAEKKPSWTWDGNLEAPTLSPSILTGKGIDKKCHSMLEAGIFHYLGDCNHSLVNQYIPLPDLEDWMVKEL